MRLTASWRGALAARSRLITACLGLLLAALAAVAQAVGTFEPLDRRLLDLYFLVRGGRGPLAPIVIVGIDYESLQRIEHPWPWPRSIHARLLRELTAAGAGLVAFDILFPDRDPAGDHELADAAEEAGNVVWASTFTSVDQGRFRIAEHRGPVAALQVPSSVLGYVDVPFDPDGTVRRMVPFRHFGADVFKSFSVAVADRYRREPTLWMSAAGTRWLGPSGSLVPAGADGSLLINFTGPPASFPTVPYVRVVEGKVPPERFRGKIVLVGAVDEGSDQFFTPFYSRRLPETSRLMAGVELHANVVEMLLRGRFLARAGWSWQALGFLVPGLALSLLVARPTWWAAGALAGVALACLLVGYAVFVGLDVWLAMAGPAVATPLVWGALSFHGVRVERREKEFVRATLERYVSPEVVEEVLSRRIDPALGGKRQTVTVLFADIRGFTGLSERLPPEALLQLLNQHFTAVSEIVLRHGGTLDKFIGDAVMAFWGAPVPREDHAVLAVRAALEMQTAVRELGTRVRTPHEERLQMGIGINTGEAIVGHVGSPARLGYTVMGDPVNLAARVEAMTREHEADVLITQFTYELVKFWVEAEELGPLPIRGRKDRAVIYRVLGLRTPASSDTR